jgi:hypothetical protein
LYCARHPLADAQWDCVRCGRYHCDACVRRVATLAACAHCDGVLRGLEVHIVPAVRDQAAELLARVTTPPALAAAVAVGTFAAASDLPVPIVDLMMGFGAALVLAATWFNAIDHIARGRPGFPAPHEVDGWSAPTLAIRGLLCLLVVLVPFGLWLAANPGAEDAAELVAGRPGTALVLGAVAQAWLTTALLSVLASVSGLAAFWPPALLTVIRRAPGRYARLLGLMAITSALAVTLAVAATAATGRIPYLSRFVAGTLVTLFLFAQATLVGGYVHRHRDLYTVR